MFKQYRQFHGFAKPCPKQREAPSVFFVYLGILELVYCESWLFLPTESERCSVICSVYHEFFNKATLTSKGYIADVVDKGSGAVIITNSMIFFPSLLRRSQLSCQREFIFLLLRCQVVRNVYGNVCLKVAHNASGINEVFKRRV